ncbi:MAG TPA: acyltransferase family protein, partial [Patescibacteria group bacterium]|nr:acyltransferase family protein [Patescibacteria group bacterium]
MLYAPEKSIFAIGSMKIMSYFIIPVFMFASGFLLAKSCENAKNITTYLLTKRLKRLLIPYLLTGILWLVPLYTLFDILVYNRPAGTSLAGGYLAFSLGLFTDHLWFLLALFWVSLFCILLSPLLKRSVVAGSVITLVTALFIQEFLQAVPYYKINQTALPIISACFGMIIYRVHTSIERLQPGRQLLITGVLLGFVIILICFDKGNAYIGWLISITGCILIYFSSALLAKINIAAIICDSTLYEWVERNSMKYYLFHMPFPYLFFLWLYPVLKISPVIFILLNFVFTLAVTTVVVLVLGKCNHLWTRIRVS